MYPGPTSNQLTAESGLKTKPCETPCDELRWIAMDCDGLASREPPQFHLRDFTSSEIAEVELPR